MPGIFLKHDAVLRSRGASTRLARSLPQVMDVQEFSDGDDDVVRLQSLRDDVGF